MTLLITVVFSALLLFSIRSFSLSCCSASMSQYLKYRLLYPSLYFKPYLAFSLASSPRRSEVLQESRIDILSRSTFITRHQSILPIWTRSSGCLKEEKLSLIILLGINPWKPFSRRTFTPTGIPRQPPVRESWNDFRLKYRFMVNFFRSLLS